MNPRVPQQLEKDVQYVTTLPPWVKWTLGGLVLLILISFFVGSYTAKRYARLENKRTPLEDSIAVIKDMMQTDRQKVDTAFWIVQSTLDKLAASKGKTDIVIKESQQIRKLNESNAEKVRQDIYRPDATNEQLRRTRASIFD